MSVLSNSFEWHFSLPDPSTHLSSGQLLQDQQYIEQLIDYKRLERHQHFKMMLQDAWCTAALAWISSQHTWSEFAKNGIMPIDIYGYVEIVKIIASFQESTNLTNTNKWTPPIHSTAQHGYTEIVKLLSDKDEIEKINCSKILYSIYPNLKKWKLWSRKWFKSFLLIPK